MKLSDYTVVSTSSKIPKNFLDIQMKVLEEMGVIEQWEKTVGKGAKVGIIDTGADLDHPDLVHSIKASYNSINPKLSAEDGDGHGTHCAGIIAAQGNLVGVAPQAELYIVKALGDNGEGTDKTIADGIDWLIGQGVDVISMSLGAQQGTPALFSAVKRAYDAGIICVCAAGNDQEGRLDVESIDYPAAYNETIAVGAIDIAKGIANFSSIGNVDVVAFGVNVLSTYKNGGYALLSGTSMATPYISGVVALYQSLAKHRLRRRLSFEEMRVLLSLNAKDLGKEGKDDIYGYGEFSF